MNQILSTSFAIAFACVFTVSAPVMAADSDAPVPAGDIVVVAQQAGSFGTLVTALEAADLVETLQGSGPFTVFAPTDAAFGVAGRGTDRLRGHDLLRTS
ncbi:fasciclin domain-containing protein, partial [Myxococcota bacterium]|nr:fasciclin domain-containing protein [Myxococcota bacterium]